VRAQLAETEADRKRLRDNNVELTTVAGQCRVQLAEAHGLLRVLAEVSAVRALRPGVIWDRLEKVLSASAEPSAPVEIDERSEFDAWFCVERGLAPDTDTTFINDAYQPWRGWQARAALERKP
jgi:hypothetical protein